MKLVESLKKYGVRGFLDKWKVGIMSLTPEQLLISEIRGYLMTIFATIFAGFYFAIVFRTLWPLALIMFFNIFIQGSQLISKYQQLQSMKMITEQFKIVEEVKEDV